MKLNYNHQSKYLVKKGEEMKRLGVLAVLLLLLPLVSLYAEAQKWDNVSLVDGMCLSKVKADPDKHTKKCLMQCASDGLGILDKDGNFLKLDSAGSDQVIALLNKTDKTDHLRLDVQGERNGDTIKVASVSLHE